MELIETGIDGLVVLEPKVHSDHRGFFMETFSKQALKELGLDCEFVQDNHSLSAEKGTLRGLHYQLRQKAQTKLVRVLSGSIYDVAVDIRKGSPTFGKWFGVVLSAENKRQLLVPKGFAHGFCTLEPNTEVAYKVDEYYSKDHDRGILWSDPSIGINWDGGNVILSDKDKINPLLADAEIDFTFGEE